MSASEILEILHETIYAEHGSALEMLAACKQTKSTSLAYGYFEHAKDEYNHTKTFKEILSNKSYNCYVDIVRKFRITPIGLITKGYVSRKGYLIETMNLKDFIAYVYTNELLAETSFAKIKKLLGPNNKDSNRISNIMDDELRHHGMAKEYFLKYYPELQPWQLLYYKTKETIKNKTRKLYHKNIIFLEKIFFPLYSLLTLISSRLLIILNLTEYKRTDCNLMDINARSIL